MVLLRRPALPLWLELRAWGKRRANWKKAMVKLTADSKTIEFFEGMV